ncbi:hypothetical protein BY996DRAFT_6422049 [Phakopsora pachyrhizi]|nr:hypothetical protein BY996DRAFT_6422049 [Phakopsora pachyrhizi]
MILPISDIVKVKLVSPRRLEVVTQQSNLVTEASEKSELEFDTLFKPVKQLISKLSVKACSLWRSQGKVLVNFEDGITNKDSVNENSAKLCEVDLADVRKKAGGLVKQQEKKWKSEPELI